MMTPRNLSVLRIDDGLKAVGDAPPDYVETHSVVGRDGAKVLCINDFSTALRYWSSPGHAAGPDLVTADVLFDDDARSPLNHGTPPLVCPDVHVDRPFPTGLSHLKPFVAYARACGKPMGIGVHTRKPELWKFAWNARHVMGGLVVAEIAEIVALLGENLEGEGHEQTAGNCWTWLSGLRATDFRGALSLALEDYRRRLLEMAKPRPGEAGPRLMITPGDWSRLAEWAQAQATRKEPEPFPADLGLPLLYRDGRLDCVRFASVFADASGERSFSFPSRCYKLRGGAEVEPWRLDSLNPQIGRFIEALGWLSQVYRSALRVLGEFPEELPSADAAGDFYIARNLTNAAKGVASHRLVAGLVVALQAIRWEWRRFLCWQTVLVERGWDVRTHTFKGIPELPTRGREPRDVTSLEDILDELAAYVWRAAATHPDDPLDLHYLKGSLPDPWHGVGGFRELEIVPPWLIWHLARLVDAGFLERGPGTGRGQSRGDSSLPEPGYRVANRGARSARRPTLRAVDVPTPTTGLPDGSGWRHDDLASYLRDSLGYGAFRPGGGADGSDAFRPGDQSNRNAIGRILAYAFLPDETSPAAIVGNRFLDNLLNGHGPAWLALLLQEYARDELGWTATRTWPEWFRTDGVFAGRP